MKYIPFTLIVLSCIYYNCRAQQMPLYTQQVFDPYLLNPSMVASGGRGEANMLYRNQWAGVTDGPKTFQADIQYPFNEKLAMGLNIYNDRTVLLSNTSINATFGYKIYLSNDQSVGFGLSAGVLSNRLKLEDVNDNQINDPALLNSVNNNSQINGQFGLHYAVRNFSIGFSSLQLFRNTSVSTEKFESLTFDAFRVMVLSGSYRFALSDVIYMQPTLTYRINEQSLNGYEGSVIFSYDNKFYAGGGYRQNFGLLLMARVKVGDLQIGYAYDLPSYFSQVSTGGTNEVQLKYQFGKEVDDGQYSIFKNYNRWYKKFKKNRSGYRRKIY